MNNQPENGIGLSKQQMFTYGADDGKDYRNVTDKVANFAALC